MLRHTSHMRATAATCVVAAASLLVVGCAGKAPGGHAAADCSTQVRLDDRVYTSYGYTDREGTKLSVADRAECHDVGPDAEGSLFPEDPEQVTVWSFEGYSPERVVGVRFDSDSYAVFVADSVPRTESDQIFEALRPSDR